MLDRLSVDPGSPAKIAERDPDDALGLDKGASIGGASCSSRRLVVAELVAGTLEHLDPRLPEPEPGLERLRIE